MSPPQALSTLVGLVAAPLRVGGFTYTHPATGFVFEMRPFSPEEGEEDDDDAAAEHGEQIAFKPLDMGPGKEVRPYGRHSIAPKAVLMFSAALHRAHLL